MGAFLAIVNRELSAVLRDRTIVIALLIQLFIASFSSALLLGVLSVYDPETVVQYEGDRIHIGIVGDPGSPLQSYLAARGLSVTPYASLADAEAAFYRGRLNAILTVPASSTGVVDVKLYLADKADAANSLIRMVIQEPLKQYENSLRARNGVEVHYTDLKGKPATSFELIYSIILPVLPQLLNDLARLDHARRLSAPVDDRHAESGIRAIVCAGGIAWTGGRAWR